MSDNTTLLKSKKRMISGGILGIIIVSVATFGLGRATNAPAAASAQPYVYTFDGDPASPQSATSLANFDVQVHNRIMHLDPGIDPMIADHGSDCAPTGSHQVSTPEESVFICRNHIMTAISDSGYGLIMLTPDRMLDWSNGEAVLSFDVSTFASSGRDWWSVTIQPFENNWALPVDPNLAADLQGYNPNSIKFQVHDGDGSLSAQVYVNGEPTMDRFGSSQFWVTVDDVLKMSKMDRAKFEFRISETHISACVVAGVQDGGDLPLPFCWVDREISPLSWSQGTVSLGHHSYNPDKHCIEANPDPECANTWHWDNLSLSPSVPFTMIPGEQRLIWRGPWDDNTTFEERTLTFPTPAPANSFLRFSAIGKITLDGQLVSPLKVPYNQGVFSSYWIPIPEGTTRIQVDGGPDGWTDTWAAKDFSIWSKNGASSSVGQAPAPATPTNTPVPAATSTPLVTATATATTTQPSPTTTSPTATPTTVPASQLQLWSCGARIGSAEVRAGQSQSVQAYVATNIDSRALVDVEIYDPTGTKVYQRYWDNRDFNASQTRNFFFRWKVPSNAMKGTYTVKIGIFNPGWAGLLMWNNNAATFEVK